jgi:arylsulfatase A-like enzyme
MNAIVLVIDRLHAGYVGAYGNTWIETPSLDRLAFQSTVFDQCLIDGPRLESLCRSYWLGEHPLCRSQSGDDRPPLPDLLANAGVTTTLLTDEPAVARHPLARTFDAAVSIDLPAQSRVAGRIDETHLAGCFARIVQWLESAREPFLLWCHLTGLDGPWDAPLEFRTRYVEQDDPDPPDWAEVPCRMLPEDYDPDELLGITQAYAGQVSLLDLCLGAVLQFLDDDVIGQRTLLILLSARGFPLGEHRRVGAYDQALHAELAQVPLLIRFPDSSGQAVRAQSLVGPGDVWATLLDCWAVAAPPQGPPAASLVPLAREEVESIHDRLCLVDEVGQGAIRTPAWYLRDAEKAELFYKPDDRWEVNDVADRCPDVVNALRQAFAQYREALRSGDLGQMPALEEILVRGLD